MRSRGRLGHAVPSLSYDSLVLRQSGLGPLQYMDGWVPYSQYTFLLSSSVSPTVQMTGPPTVNTYAPVFLLWIPHSTQMSGSPTVKYTCFIFLVCVQMTGFHAVNTHVPIFSSIYRCSCFWGSHVWVLYSTQTTGSPAVNTQMFLFLRDRHLELCRDVAFTSFSEEVRYHVHGGPDGPFPVALRAERRVHLHHVKARQAPWDRRTRLCQLIKGTGPLFYSQAEKTKGEWKFETAVA